MNTDVSNSDDVIDSRDVISAIAELESQIEDMKDSDNPTLDMGDIEEAQAQLDILNKLAEQGKDSPDWEYGETLIRDSYFQDYAEELADDIGAVDEKVSSQWPYTCIDWERAARDLQQDYMQVDFDGVDYWIRA